MRVPQLPQIPEPDLVPIPATKARGFIVRSYREPTFRFIWHYHPEWEITWVGNARGLRYVGRSIEPFESGDLVMMAGNIPHAYHSDPRQVGDTRCTVIHFLPQMWGEAFWQLPEIGELRNLLDRSVRGIRFSGPGVKEIGRRMEELATRNVPTFDSLVSLAEIFQLLLRSKAHSLNAESDTGEAKPNARLQELLEWIESRVTQPITQADVAAQVRMSPAAFSRWFKIQMGCVFHRYLNELRVARACSILVKSDGSITETAFAAGFSNLSNFNRRFQEITGLTPKAFRCQFRSRD